jgi:hypothetical protein
MLKHKIALATLVVVSFVSRLGAADEAPPQEQVTLLGMLLEWRYPEAKFNGAETSDAAVAEISAIKSKAVLTTPDSAAKVMAFYRKKLNVDAEGRNLGEKEGERITTDRSVLIQDVSGDRASKLYVIAIIGTMSSTTLVVSRTEGDDVTRIAWSNYRQLRP